MKAEDVFTFRAKLCSECFVFTKISLVEFFVKLERVEERKPIKGFLQYSMSEMQVSWAQVLAVEW